MPEKTPRDPQLAPHDLDPVVGAVVLALDDDLGDAAAHLLEQLQIVHAVDGRNVENRVVARTPRPG